ncbi:hypothetical protein CUS_7295 [Ruminococcus albus 8]|uniref:Uncharacterized protein n=1 Tax=Ruminococcus albus 8 TaxID=246199 RepID=E9S7S0_RUMAL|nr:hypothetical protein CUS_7295 [Ruminococcus albus 8]
MFRTEKFRFSGFCHSMHTTVVYNYSNRHKKFHMTARV